MSAEHGHRPNDLGFELERVSAELETLRASHHALEEAVNSRDTVLSVVAHDLRNPLNVISLAANALLQRLPSPAARRPIERIVRSAHRAQRMVSDLLSIGALETGQFALELKTVETSGLILLALESQQGVAAEASLIVGTDVSPELPPLQGDEERLLEVLDNLIGNAVKFTGAGGSITVGASTEGGEVKLWVKDTGTGIPPEQLPHIFDRFWQAKKKERRGIGLGLSICKAIVEAHGGRIWAESKPGAGTTLFFTIPAAPKSAPAGDKRSVASILLVDDRPENLVALKAILERPDYNLVTAQSGQEALALVLREKFHVALIDIAMPTMNGFEVAAHLKDLHRTRDIPIIFVTAFGNDPDEIHRAYAAGGADYLVKPLDPEIVRKKVAVFVELARR
jgi:CheY-like chemotaxis protein